MSLIPVVVKSVPFVIPKSMDEIERENKTLKELRELAKEIDVDIFGPKGGMIAKKPLLKRIKVYFDVIEEKRLSEIKAKKEIIREHNEGLIKYKEARIKVLLKDVKKLRSEEQKFRVLCDKKEAEIEELRAVIRSLI